MQIIGIKLTFFQREFYMWNFFFPLLKSFWRKIIDFDDEDYWKKRERETTDIRICCVLAIQMTCEQWRSGLTDTLPFPINKKPLTRPLFGTMTYEWYGSISIDNSGPNADWNEIWEWTGISFALRTICMLDGKSSI